MAANLEQGRSKFGSVFEAANLGKSSVVLDYRTPEGLAHFKQLV